MTAPAAPLGPAADPDVIAAAVAACPDVVALSGGTVGEVETYLPARRVAGVRIAADAIEVHVVARYGPTVAGVAAHRARQGSTRAGSEVVFVRRRRGLRILTGWWRDRRATRRGRAPRVH